MAFITIQIRGVHIVRHRDGEDLEDPVSEFDDGDGENLETIAHFNTGLQVNEALDIDIDTGPTVEEGLSADLAAGGIGLVQLPSNFAEERKDEDPEKHQGEEEKQTEGLRRALVEKRGEGLRAWLRVLAAEARAHPSHRFELKFAHRVPTGWLRCRLRILNEEFELKAVLRPEIAHSETRSVVSVRREEAPRGLTLHASGCLELDGGIRELQLELDAADLPEPSRELERELRKLASFDPTRVAGQLLLLARKDPSAVAHLARAMLEKAESVQSIDPLLAQRAFCVFGDFGPKEKLPALSPPRDLSLDWSDNGEPLLTAGGDRGQRRPLEGDLWIFRRLAGIACATPSENAEGERRAA